MKHIIVILSFAMLLFSCKDNKISEEKQIIPLKSKRQSEMLTALWVLLKKHIIEMLLCREKPFHSTLL